MIRFCTFSGLIASLALAACAPPQPGPPPPRQTAQQQAEQRAAVEVYVKTHHPALLADIAAGGGPNLTAAEDLARIAAATRPILLLRLQSNRTIYQTSPEALVIALMWHARALTAPHP